MLFRTLFYHFKISFSYFVVLLISVKSNADVIQVECKHVDSSCDAEDVDLSKKTFGQKFSFSASQENKEKISEISFRKCGRVAHVPSNLFHEIPKLTKLWIKDSDIPILRNKLFGSQFSRILGLDLRFDNIRTIEDQAFTELTDLVDINLENNELKSLNSKLFAENRKLEYIILLNNKIKFIEPGTFRNLIELIWIDHSLNECFDQQIGCHQHCPGKRNQADIDQKLQRCYDNYKASSDSLNEGEIDVH
jgi:hypothetical protein